MFKLPFGKPKEEKLVLPPWVKSMEERGTVRIVRIKGGLPFGTMEDYEKHRARMRDRKGFRYMDLLIDFAELEYMDSAIVAAIVQSLKDYKQAQHRVAIVNLRSEPRSVLEITKVDRLITCYDSEEAALKALSQPPARS